MPLLKIRCSPFMFVHRESCLKLFLVILVFFSFLVEVRAGTVSKEQVFQVALLAARDGEYEKAIEFFKKVLELDPRFAPAYNSLGLVYQSMQVEGSAVESARYFKLAVDVDAGFVDGWNNLGRAYYAAGRFLEAEQALLKSLELDANQPGMALVLGWVELIGLSRAEKAIQYFEQGLSQIDDAMSYYGIGLANILLGERFKVFDQITELRRRTKDDLAARLEDMVRNNVRISSRPGMPLITGVEQEGSVFAKELQSLAAGGFNAVPGGKGIQVRLKGPLAD